MIGLSLEFLLKASDSSGALPAPEQLAKQEIALNFNEAGCFLTCKDSAGAIRRLNEVWLGAAPTNPTPGLLWLDNTGSDPEVVVLKAWISTGEGWKVVGGGSGPGPGPGPSPGGGVQSIGVALNSGLLLSGSQSNPVINTDSTIVRTTNDQTVNGKKTFLDPIVGDLEGNATSSNLALAVKRSVLGGIGLNGGGELTVDQTLNLDIAGSNSLGGVKIGNGIKIIADGTISAEFPQIFNNKGSIDITTKLAPSAPEDGDFYINTVTGIAGASWIGLAGQSITAGSLALWVKSNNQWEGGGGLVTGVIEVLSGDGVTVINPKSASPQVTVNASVIRNTRKINTGAGLTGGNNLNQDLNLAVIPATTSTLGGVKVGANLDVTIDGTLSLSIGNVLQYKDTIDPNGNAPSPLVEGDVYIASDSCAEVNASWIGLVPKSVLLHQLLIWNGTFWSGAGVVDSIGVDSIIAGDGISVKDPLSNSPTVSVNTSVVRTGGAQTIADSKTFTSTIIGDISGNAGTATNSLFADTATKLTRLVTPSNGISGGGELIADIALECDATVIRTFGAQTLADTKTFTSLIIGNISGNSATSDTALLANDAVKCQRSVTGTDGIQGGGTLQTDQVLSVDLTVIRTSGSQTLADTKTFTSLIIGNISGNAGTTDHAILADDAVKCQRSVTGTDGIQGGGTLQSDQVLSVDSSVVRTSGAQTLADTKTFTSLIIGNISGNAATSDTALLANDAVKCQRSVTGTDGIQGGGTLQSDQVLSLDSSVVRTSGAQNIADTKTFTSTIIGNISGNAATSDTALLANDSVKCQRSVTGTDGIQGGGSLQSDQTLSVDSSVVRTSNNQTINDQKTFTSTIIGNISGNAGSANNANFAETANKCNRSVNGNDGIQGGGDLNNDVTLSLDSSVVRTGGDQSIGGTKSFNNTINGNLNGTASMASDLNISGLPNLP